MLNVLDKHNISFCQFIERLLALDDSSYAVAKQKFPDPYQQAEFTAIHDEAIEIAEAEYLKSLKVSSRLATFAIVAYSFDKKIKEFCGK
ncbi:hypothetical protein CTE07_45840 [Chitinophaga terrae (ex Kim and Jung 2007)]|nr:hypothetical protein CTE07_45840 [Chitinophaga terrae (ex Kim and Jung 2007)]